VNEPQGRGVIYTHAKNVDLPHPASPSRSRETVELLSGRGLASAIVELLSIGFMCHSYQLLDKLHASFACLQVFGFGIYAK
jgi:hypothetical protein